MHGHYSVKHLIAGVIGKPNTGKSTFFNAATLLNVAMANYPFTTITPNLGVAYLRVKCVHQELNVSDNPQNSLCVEGTRLIPVKLVDVAGLVPGASKGRGLGNKFLDDLRQADALIHVVDSSGSTDVEGKNVEAGSHDPLEDIGFVEEEFDLWLADIVSRDWVKIARAAEADKSRFLQMLSDRLSGLAIKQEQIMVASDRCSLKLDKALQWSDDDIKRFCSVLRQISKPSLIAANKADLPTSKTNIEKLKKTGRFVVPTAAEAELLLRRASEKGLIRYLPGDKDFEITAKSNMSPQQIKALELVREMVLSVWGSTGVQEVVNSVYLNLLKCIVVYPVEDESKFSDKKGNVLPDARVVPLGSTAKELAYSIHTDLGDSFLYALDAKTGMRLGAEHQLKNSDVVKIVATGRRG
jgi:ribosome-binding ATPase YchF (GTP1/OBG family)